MIIPGLLQTGFLMPMINEAVYSLYEGVAGVEANRYRDEIRNGPSDGAIAIG